MQPTPLRHRAELWKLAFIELWERFGFYVMLDLLVMMLISVMGMTKGDASDVYGKWNAAVYLAPLLGGYLADRYLGYRKSVLLGATIMAAGYLSMAAAFYLKQIYGIYGSMMVIILGNGLFKPNMSALVGNLYPAGDKRTDSAFSIFYVAVNIGALAAPMAAATIRHHYSMPVAVMVAGLGMMVAVAATLYSWRSFAALDRTSSVAAVTGIALPPEYDDAPESPKVEREKIRAIATFCAIVMAFWIAFHQNGSTLTYWATDNTDLTLGGLMSISWLAKALNAIGWAKDGQVDPVLFATINSFCIIGFTPIVLWMFKVLERHGIYVSTPAKIGAGMFLTAVTCATMAAASYAGGDTGRVSALWLTGSYAQISAAELLLSPMGLAMVTKLAPRRHVGVMLGMWYLSVATGNYLCGKIGMYWTAWSHHTFFLVLAGISLAPLGLLAWQYRRLLAVMNAPRPAAVLARAPGAAQPVPALA